MCVSVCAPMCVHVPKRKKHHETYAPGPEIKEAERKSTQQFQLLQAQLLFPENKVIQQDTQLHAWTTVMLHVLLLLSEPNRNYGYSSIFDFHTSGKMSRVV